ncbi:diguanylate cyclase [Sulfurospirillum sp. 1612]|uniref:diguanylate cyclase n=1 Tax=Sulfurospirillum sp. 1612 TaxID=3094835 RepID=UPI002F9252D5
MKVNIVALILILFITSTAVMCKEPEKVSLRFLGNINYAPLLFMNNDTPTGLGVELVHAVLHSAQIDGEVELMEWDEAQKQMKAGKADALVLINKSPARLELYDFSEPFLESDFSIFHHISRPEINTLNSLSGLKVGSEKGGYARTILENNPNIEIITIPNWLTGFRMIEAGTIDALLTEKWVGEYTLSHYKISDIAISPIPTKKTTSYIAVAKGNKALLDKINEGLRKLSETDVRERILSHWSSETITYITNRELKAERLHKLMLLLAMALLSILGALGVYSMYQQRIIKQQNQKLKDYNTQLEELFVTDKLTGLYNRHKLDDTLISELMRFKRYQAPLSIIIMDIDFFKSINDTYGHQVGDEVLKDFANLNKNAIRSSDILGRWGGEEFLIICPETDLESAYILAEKLRSILESHEFANVGNITASFGVTTATIGANVDNLIAQADDALYKAKSKGRNRVERFSAE